MSIPFQDQSDYLRDMEELDDLMPAVVDTADSNSYQEHTYEVVDESPPNPLTQERHADSETPRSPDDFIPKHLIDAIPKHTPPQDSEKPALPASKDDWGCSDSGKPGRTSWFGSGGKAPESEDEVKKGLLARIDAYRATWPWLDERITFPANLHKKSPEKLKAILEECSNKVQNRNMTSMLGIVFSTAICAIENLCTKQFGWTDLKGFALECETDETIKNSVKEIEIKYFASSKAMAPEARLAIALLQKLVAVTNRNRSQRLLEEVARRPLDGSALQGYDDL